MINFGYNIVAGTVLVIDSVQSPNFIAGTSGWIIRQDGTVEFANATIRGVFEADGANGSFVRVTTTGGTGFGTAVIYLRPPDLPSIASGEITPGAVTVLSNQPGGAGVVPSSYLQMELDSPAWAFGSTATDVRYPAIVLRTASHDGTVQPFVTFTTGGAASNPKTFNVNLDSNVVINGNLVFGDYGKQVGKGFVVGTGATAAGPAAGATETVTLQLPSTTFKAGRAYALVASGMVTASVAPNNPVLRFRKDDGSSPPTGQQLDVWRVACPNAATTFNAHYLGYFRVGAADVTAALFLTITGSGAFNATLSGSATSPSSFVVNDVGTQSDYNWAPILV